MASQVASVSTSEEALVDYQEEMRASREELLKTIARSSEDIAGGPLAAVAVAVEALSLWL